MTLEAKNIAALRERLNHLAQLWLSADDLIPQTRVDLEVTLDQLDLDVIAQLEQLAPFGMGNPTPLVMLRDVGVSDMRKIGRDENHLKCRLTAGELQLEAIGFELAQAAEQIAPTASLHVLGELSINEWNGRRKPQLLIRDLAVPHRQVFDWRGAVGKPNKWLQLAGESDLLTVTFAEHHYQELNAYWAAQRAAHDRQPNLLCPARAAGNSDLGRYRTLVLYDLPMRRADLKALLSGADQLERIYCLFGDADSLEQLHFPSREQFKQLYQIFYQYRQVAKKHLDALARKQQLKRPTLDRMLAVFVELQFILEQDEHYLLHPRPAKAPLSSSHAYCEWQEQAELVHDLILSSSESLTKLLNQWVAAAPVQEATSR
jgi:single-stranded-DNA-specific exonuclease